MKIAKKLIFIVVFVFGISSSALISEAQELTVVDDGSGSGETECYDEFKIEDKTELKYFCNDCRKKSGNSFKLKSTC